MPGIASEPKEILTSPFEVYITKVVSAVFPAIDAEPSADWVLLGLNGSRNMDEAGITLDLEQTTSPIRVAGSTGPVKMVRTEEALRISFTLLDYRPDMVTHVLNGRDVETVAAGVDAGHKSIGMFRGPGIQDYKLLMRGLTASPELLGQPAQFEVPRCAQIGSPTTVFSKGAAAGLAFEFEALEDLDAAEEEDRFGRFRVMTAEGSGS